MARTDKTEYHTQIRWIFLLLIAVSLTSCIIGYIIGRSATTADYPTGYMMDTILLSPDGQGEAAQKTYFKLTGRVLYTDGTPYANSRVELHSNPRYTYTDTLGYFSFEDVEPGNHVINVVRDGVVQASCIVEVDANASYKDTEIVQLDDGSFSIRISLDVSVLELTLVLENDRITPQLSEGYAAQEDDSGLPENADLPKPPDTPKPPAIIEDPETPEPPVIPEPPLPPSPPAGGSPTPSPSSGAPDRAPAVETTGQGSSQSWSLLTTVDIFGERDGNHNTRKINDQTVISPGASGSYLFQVKNIEAYDIEYGIRLTDTDENHPALPMKYRLKTGSAYIGGNQWKAAKDLQAETKTLLPGSSEDYALEWKWESVSDSGDTSIGKQAGSPRYILKIRINAQFK